MSLTIRFALLFMNNIPPSWSSLKVSSQCCDAKCTDQRCYDLFLQKEGYFVCQTQLDQAKLPILTFAQFRKCSFPVNILDVLPHNQFIVIRHCVISLMFSCGIWPTWSVVIRIIWGRLFFLRLMRAGASFKFTACDPLLKSSRKSDVSSITHGDNRKTLVFAFVCRSQLHNVHSLLHMLYATAQTRKQCFLLW